MKRVEKSEALWRLFRYSRSRSKLSSVVMMLQRRRTPSFHFTDVTCMTTDNSDSLHTLSDRKLTGMMLRSDEGKCLLFT